MRGGDPEVRGASVEVNDKVLARRPDGNWADPFEILLLVNKRLVLTLIEGNSYSRREAEEGQNVGTLGECLTADIALEVDQVLTVFTGDIG